MGYETHVFAWREGATGAEDADFFYEISIVEMDAILEECRKIKPDAVATIGSDLANITVQYLAEKLGLPGNSSECIRQSTNKYAMRSAFQKAGIPVPYFACVGEGESVEPEHFPVIVKPTDRSGSRAITKVTDPSELPAAIEAAITQSFEKKAIVEEYISGAEYSVETISYQGKHTCLAITRKFTTGSPHYIEVGHLQPAPLTDNIRKQVEETVFRALDALGAELACERITGEEIRELKKACEDFEKAAAGNDADAIAKADVAFHDIIIRAAGNQRLEQLVNNLAEQMYRYRFVYIKEEEQRGVLLAEHREICDSIAARDVVRARNAAKQHIDNQQKAVIRQIRLEKRK